MQRKNSLLRKDGFAMIMAITVLVIIATILALSLALTTQTTKKTEDLYLYEQATILSHSAAEYAILRASLVPPCSFPGVSFSYNNTFDINVTMQYIATNPSTCHTNASIPVPSLEYATINYPNSNGTVIMDITVITKVGIATEPIRYFRRTIQKL